MNWVDGLILVILGLSVLIGLFRGLVAELLSLLIWVAAFVVAAWFGPDVASLFTHAISLSVARLSLGYAICFIGVLLIGALVRFAARKLIWTTGLTGVDRLLGVVFGFVRGVLVVTLAVFLVGLTSMTRESWWQQSTLLPQFQGTAAWLGQNVPPDWAEHLNPEVVLDKLKAEPMLQRHAPGESSSSGHAPNLLGGAVPSQLVQQIHNLSERIHDPMSARGSPPAGPSTARTPAANSSVTGQPRHP